MKCFFFHKWGKWQDQTEQNLLRVKDESVIGKVLEQKRYCEECGKLQIDREEFFI